MGKKPNGKDILERYPVNKFAAEVVKEVQHLDAGEALKLLQSQLLRIREKDRGTKEMLEFYQNRNRMKKLISSLKKKAPEQALGGTDGSDLEDN
ncbi:MAG: hypothetical protein QXY76_03235 [Nitrososphaeria archaeon]